MYLPVFYNRTYTDVANNSETTAKSRVIAESLLADPIGGVDVVDPQGFTDEADRLINTLHSASYVDAVRTATRWPPRLLASYEAFLGKSGQ